jgi:Bacterial Ig-like domain (group 2)/Galactose oxidase, central domain
MPLFQRAGFLFSLLGFTSSVLAQTTPAPAALSFGNQPGGVAFGSRAEGMNTTGNDLRGVPKLPPRGWTRRPVLTGSLSTFRVYHTATLLNNGMVLVAGGLGDTSNTALASAELYNPATGAFTPTGSMNAAREFHTATLPNNGMVLVAGGAGDNPIPGDSPISLASAELYDPATGIFIPTGSLNAARNSHTATMLNSGMVLVAGGAGDVFSPFLASAELYNPTTGIFSPAGSLNTGRSDHTATLLNNGMVLVAGGSGSGGAVASAELYDPATGAFSFTGSPNTARYLHTATLLNGGMVLVAGGEDNGSVFASAELYEPTTGAFTFTGSLNTARILHTATLLSNGMVLIVGGFSGQDGSAFASAELYKPASGTFTSTESLNTARYSQSATLLDDGMVLVAGGLGAVTLLASAELYELGILTPANLVSIAVTPEMLTLSPGATQQFIATGTFSDSSTEQLASVTWSSSDTTLAQISNDASNHGSALAVAAGTVTITATAGSVRGSAALAVR